MTITTRPLDPAPAASGAVSFLVVLLAASGCGGKSAAKAAEPIPVRAKGFTVQKTPLELPGRCVPDTVTNAFVRMTRAFNEGRGEDFARAFRPLGTFDAYAATAPHPGVPFLRGRREVASFVATRHAAGDQWTLLFVSPPTGRARLPEAAIYGLGIRVSSEGYTVSEGGAKAVVHCATGEILNWVGPSRGPK
jgi:hypothetical protein